MFLPWFMVDDCIFCEFIELSFRKLKHSCFTIELCKKKKTQRIMQTDFIKVCVSWTVLFQHTKGVIIACV
jgi:hypothetical protein